ncbi:MAG TPA: DUF559 domain-containing protein [Nitrospirae bacterium]|nr:DUF559 domain-containing protein [Nitrospirota bacterium]HDL20823.1 DUF559 domain-containing protein [Nitrospirota bacterium]HDO21725.1 DUF559 domain-containing protein [Nitrospirota bacterium]HDO22756.1 DUF559 domain-containing protein [Nitrospirota bacterium]HDZ87468.1 DUF559 domain-containing protein [Nitrospirota bacterium]
MKGDFQAWLYCPEGKLVIELDGSRHYSEEGIIRDIRRDRFIESPGLRIPGFSDREIPENLTGVLEKIWSYL